jgi:hypothetical protein
MRHVQAAGRTRRKQDGSTREQAASPGRVVLIRDGLVVETPQRRRTGKQHEGKEDSFVVPPGGGCGADTA